MEAKYTQDIAITINDIIYIYDCIYNFTVSVTVTISDLEFS